MLIFHFASISFIGDILYVEFMKNYGSCSTFALRYHVLNLLISDITLLLIKIYL